MNEEYVNLPLVKNPEKMRFEINIGDLTAFIDYKERNKKIWLIHTEAPEELKGKGAGTAIVEKTLSYLEENGYILVPVCTAVQAYLKRHPEWNRLLDSNAQAQ